MERPPSQPQSQPEKMSIRQLAMLCLGGFAVGFVVGPVLLLQLMLAWMGGLAVFLAIIYFHFVFPFPFDLLFGKAASGEPESPKDSFFALAALSVGFVLGSALVVFIVAPEVSDVWQY